MIYFYDFLVIVERLICELFRLFLSRNRTEGEDCITATFRFYHVSETFQVIWLTQPANLLRCIFDS